MDKVHDFSLISRMFVYLYNFFPDAGSLLRGDIRESPQERERNLLLEKVEAHRLSDGGAASVVKHIVLYLESRPET